MHRTRCRRCGFLHGVTPAGDQRPAFEDRGAGIVLPRHCREALSADSGGERVACA